MTDGDGYALDLLSPVRHVATEMERAGSAGPAPTVAAMAATYEHTIAGDLARIRQHENVVSDYEARLWLIRRAVAELGIQVTPDGDGYRLGRPFDDLKYKGRKVRPAVRAGEESEKEVLAAAYHNLEKELRPYHVTVAGARGTTREAELTLHPLAHAIPRMKPKEWEALAADVRANGVKLPITVMGGKVIDGRHRLAVAAALKVPVRVHEFTGAEEEARRHIVSLNVIRRNLTMAQRGLIVREIFLPEAKAEASVGRPQKDQGKLAPSGANIPAGKKASEIAADRSMGLANARTVERMAPVDDAPQTQERIRRGEITTATEARREALKETGSDEPQDVPVLQPRSAYHNLGLALSSIRNAIASIEKGDPATVPEQKLLERADEIGVALHDLRKLLLP